MNAAAFYFAAWHRQIGSELLNEQASPVKIAVEDSKSDLLPSFRFPFYDEFRAEFRLDFINSFFLKQLRILH